VQKFIIPGYYLKEGTPRGESTVDEREKQTGSVLGVGGGGEFSKTALSSEKTRLFLQHRGRVSNHS